MHKPVLLNEILKIFNPQSGQTYIDATVNGGGHSAAILERIGPHGTLLGIDWDCDLLQRSEIRNQKSKISNLLLVCGNYVNLPTIVRKYNLGEVSGILFDLGFSSYHLEISQRGFSFLKNEDLDMRYNPNEELESAKDIVNKWPREAIEDILRKYGEERFSRRIAEGIVRTRERQVISTTGELVEIISRSIPRRYLRSRIHPATRTFQALRLAVNRELENIDKGIRAGVQILKPGGKIVVISFHSLEDRLVKQIFIDKKDNGEVVILTKKPIVSGELEKKGNPRSRSAKLRAAVKL